MSNLDEAQNRERGMNPALQFLFPLFTDHLALLLACLMLSALP